MPAVQKRLYFDKNIIIYSLGIKPLMKMRYSNKYVITAIDYAISIAIA